MAKIDASSLRVACLQRRQSLPSLQLQGASAGYKHKIVAVGVGVGVSLGVLSAVMLGAGFLWGRRKTRVKYEGLPVQKPVTAPEGQMMFAALQLHGSNPIYEAKNSQIMIPCELPVPEGK